MALTSNQPAESHHFSIFHLIGTLFFGLIVGIIAKLLVPGANPGGIIVTILLGMGGGVIGSYLGRALGWYGPGHPAGFIMAVVGAIILLLIYHLLVGGRGRTTESPNTRTSVERPSVTQLVS